MTTITQHYDNLASQRDSFIRKNSYYYSFLYKEYRYLIPKGKKVLEVGCGTGELLNAVEPALGVGIDLSSQMIQIARKKFPHLQFHSGTIDDGPAEKFDYIICSGLFGELDDIQVFLQRLRRLATSDTRLIIEYYSVLWQYLLKLGEKLKAKIPQRIQNWLTQSDIENFLRLAEYEPIKLERIMLFPFYIPLISTLINRFVAQLPVFNALTLNHFMIARPCFPVDWYPTVTILIPCRNERGNIENAIKRIPEFAPHQEIQFVDNNSTDGTVTEIERVMKAYPEKDIKLILEPQGGKGYAVRKGFSLAKEEILIILDADLTTTPEDLPKFYEAIRTNQGEFINGSRLVYPMEKEAMRFLNLCANKFFSWFFTWLLGQRFKDTLCGTKVLSKKHYDELAANRHYFGDFDPFGDFDLIFGAVKLNLKVIELPIRYRDRTYGQSKIKRLKHGWLLIRMCAFAMKKIKFK